MKCPLCDRPRRSHDGHVCYATMSDAQLLDEVISSLNPPTVHVTRNTERLIRNLWKGLTEDERLKKRETFIQQLEGKL